MRIALFILSLFSITSFADTPLTEWAAHSSRELLPFYQDLHRNPELSYFEEKTAEKLAAEWKTAGFQVTTKFGGFGVIGILKNGDGPVLLIRTDLDALPVEEKTGIDCASKTKVKMRDATEVGVMHACGHDIHITNLVGVARYLASHKEAWRGTVFLIGQPAEEKGQGALKMLKAGLFEKFPKPNYAIALHVSSLLEAGKIGYMVGPSMSSADSIDVTLRGKGGHGAMPQNAIDPIVLGAKFILDLQTLVTREFNPVEPVLITAGSFHCGTKHNIIPDECKIQLTVRSYSEKNRAHLLEGIRRKAKAIAAGANAPEPIIEDAKDGTPSLYNDPKLAERLVPALKAALGDKNVVEVDKLMVSEDFSRYWLEGGVPTFMLHAGSINKSRFEKLKKSEAGLPSLHSGVYYPDAVETLTATQVALISEALELLKK